MKKIWIRIIIVLLIVMALAAVYTFLFPLDGRVKTFRCPVSEGYTGDFAENSALSDLSYIRLDGNCKPETVLYRDGYLYSSVHGKLLKTAEDGSGTEVLFDSENGETIGFDFDADGNIVFCDVRYAGTTPGIYKLDLSGDKAAAVPLCTEVEGKALTCPDALAIADNGIIFFSDATEFSPVKYENATLAIQYECYYHSSNGKVCAFDPKTCESWVVASGFSGANGIAVSFDQKYLYLCETVEYSVWRIPVETRNGTKGNGAELFLSNLPGYVDNLNRGQNGVYWVGLVSPRDPSWDTMQNNTFLRTILLRYGKIADPGTREAMPKTGTAAVFAFDDSGTIRQFLMAKDSEYHHVTGVCETDNKLYFHSNNFTGEIAYIEK